jgi:hypothetical protein
MLFLTLLSTLKTSLYTPLKRGLLALEYSTDSAHTGEIKYIAIAKYTIVYLYIIMHTIATGNT